MHFRLFLRLFRRRRAALGLAIFIVGGALQGQTPALPSADTVMSHAKAQAAAGHKNILLAFSASWCGPCHQFEEFLEDPSIKPILQKRFVFATLDVGERPGDKRHADSPGAEDLRAQLGGASAGYPYILMLDATGTPIVNSYRPGARDAIGENIGYPAVPVEIDWFMEMLRRSAPGLSAGEAATIRTWLQQHGHN